MLSYVFVVFFAVLVAKTYVPCWYPKTGWDGAMRTFFKIAAKVLFYVFISVCAILIIASFSMKKDANDAFTVLGFQARIVLSDSMEECESTDVSQYPIKSIPVKSVVFIEMVPEDELEAKAWFNELEVGDVLTFRYVYGGQMTITHRIVTIDDSNPNGRILTLEGDNKNASTNLMQQTLDTSQQFNATNYNYTIGKVKGQSQTLGLLVYALNTPVGMLCMVVFPCLIVVFMESIKISNLLQEEKFKKLAEEQAQQQADFELIKQQFAELQAIENAAKATQDANGNEK